MRRLTLLIGILLLAGVMSVPVVALSQGWGWGHPMMGYWGNSPGYGGYYGNLTSQQRSKLDTLTQKYYDETRGLQDQIWTKSGELNALLSSANPDMDKAKALQKEISDLQAKMDEQTLTYQLEARKIAPDQRLGYGYGWYGHHMGAYGRGMGYGYGPGYCWR